MTFRQTCTLILPVPLILATGGGLSTFTRNGGGAFHAVAWAEDSWRSELEELCGHSNDAMTFSREQLATLIERCDRLKARIEGLDESTRKVYGKRLKMCRDFYVFMLETKEAATKSKGP